MSKLDITESRLPQDGKISLKISSKNYMSESQLCQMLMARELF